MGVDRTPHEAAPYGSWKQGIGRGLVPRSIPCLLTGETGSGSDGGRAAPVVGDALRFTGRIGVDRTPHEAAPYAQGRRSDTPVPPAAPALSPQPYNSSR